MTAAPIIHVGLHKTATTFLQERIFPQLSSINLITRPYTQHNHAFNRLQYADDSLYSAAAVSRELEKICSRPGRLLLSDESFSGKPIAFNYINRSMVAARLRDLLPDSKILLFIRGQIDIIYSHYNQYVRRGGTKALEKFLWKSERDFPLETNESIDYGNLDLNGKKELLSTLVYNTNAKFIQVDNYKYLELVETYNQLFEHVEVFAYEDIVSEPQGVCDRLSEIFEQPVDIRVGEDKRVNTAIDPYYLNALRVANRLESVIGTKYIRAAAHSLPSARPPWYDRRTYHKKIQNIVGDYYKENNRCLVEKYPMIGIQKYPDKYMLP